MYSIFVYYIQLFNLIIKISTRTLHMENVCMYLIYINILSIVISITYIWIYLYCMHKKKKVIRAIIERHCYMVCVSANLSIFSAQKNNNNEKKK